MNIDIDKDDDFGFTAVIIDESEDTRAKEMYDAIMPLLTNLAKDSDTSDYIKWPNRKKKIQEFIKKLDKILNSRNK